MYNILIEYHGIMRETAVPIMKCLQDHRYKTILGDVLDLEKISGLDDNQLLTLAISRTTENIIEYLSKTQLDFSTLCESIVSCRPSIMMDSPQGNIMSKLTEMVNINNMDINVIIYTPTYDSRVELDITQLNFTSSNRISYEYGGIRRIFIAHKPNIAILSSIDNIKMINIPDEFDSSGKIEAVDISKVDFLISNHGYNYQVNELDMLVLRYGDLDHTKVNINTFTPFELKPTTFGNINE